jgi:cobalt-zinc-cadmium efflux system outer membrane protein
LLQPPPVAAEPIPLPPVGPGGGDRLTLAEAQSLAEGSHPALREASARAQAARGNWLQVGLLPNPSVGYMGQEIGNEDTAGLQGWYVENEFITAGKLGWNRAVAIREVAIAEQRAEVLRLQRVEREATMLLEVQATERRNAAWRRLATAIGLREATPPALDDALNQPLPEMNWELVRGRLISESPELAELRYEVERARYAVQRASAGGVPNILLQAGTQHDNMTDDNIANVQIGVPLPIFNRNQGAVAQACGELAAAQAALERRELALELRLAEAMRDYATARERALKCWSVRSLWAGGNDANDECRMTNDE